MSGTGPTGVLVIDKPAGLTSHDVVACVRRRLRLRRVGHAGTLDPLATGVLVVMVGAATKLGPFLTAEDKTYAARVQLGWTTTTLDGEGEETDRVELPSWWFEPRLRDERLERALHQERCRVEQRPPAYSAIKVAGRRAHARARAGEAVTLSARPVQVRRLDRADDGADLAAGALDLTMTVSKGYYVRSLARDLGRRLGLPAHLAKLRRLASGPFELDRAVAPDLDPEALRAALLPLERAARIALPEAELNADGRRKATTGQVLSDADFRLAPAAEAAATAWFDEAGALVAVGEGDGDGRFRVLRGFASGESTGG